MIYVFLLCQSCWGLSILLSFSKNEIFTFIDFHYCFPIFNLNSFCIFIISFFLFLGGLFCSSFLGFWDGSFDYWLFSSFLNYAFYSYKFPSQYCFSYFVQILIFCTFIFIHFNVYVITLRLPLWHMHYLNVCFLVYKCLEILWFYVIMLLILVWFSYVQRIHSLWFQIFIFVEFSFLFKDMVFLVYIVWKCVKNVYSVVVG